MLKGKKLPAFLMGGSILLLMALVSACGYNGTTVGSQSSPSPTTTPTAQPPLVRNCGTVHTIRDLVVPTEENTAKRDESCFAQAYAACHPAVLTYSQSNLDTGTIHNFTIKNQNGPCTITDTVQMYIAPNKPHTTGTYTCGSAALKNDGLHVNSCGSEGDVFVPVATAQ
ncbi:MAG TPA: hypothetical protein VKV20_19495 [Ktedonobacteraceae bacterium]|jgi:hypothetical protein|nr:hypothetical protein [Ktedonobacteraceae bacterium]